MLFTSISFSNFFFFSFFITSFLSSHDDPPQHTHARTGECGFWYVCLRCVYNLLKIFGPLLAAFTNDDDDGYYDFFLTTYILSTASLKSDLLFFYTPRNQLCPQRIFSKMSFLFLPRHPNIQLLGSTTTTNISPWSRPTIQIPHLHTMLRFFFRSAKDLRAISSPVFKPSAQKNL